MKTGGHLKHRCAECIDGSGEWGILVLYSLPLSPTLATQPTSESREHCTSSGVQGTSRLNTNLPAIAMILLTFKFNIAVYCTRSSADAVKPARRVQRSIKVTKYSTIPYVRYSFLLVWNSRFEFKTRRFSDIRLQQCRDLEIRVRGHSGALKVLPFDGLGMVFY